MNIIHDDKVNNISRWKLLYGILNYFKSTKNINVHYSPILHGCMDTRRGKANLKNFRTLLGSGCSYNILRRGLINKLKTKKYVMMKWKAQAGNPTTNMKFKIYFALPELSATKP